MTRNAILTTALASAGVVALLAGPLRPGRGAEPPPDSAAQPSPARGTPVYQHRVVRSYPHDRKAFTQGLVYRDGVFYESTGLYGESSLRKVAIETGEVLRRHDVEARYFAEGLSEWGETLVQLTWTTGVAIAYDRETFKEVRRFAYTGEGWGLTRTDRHFVMSDGSATLKLLDPSTFAQVSTLQVRDEHGPVTALNELEMVRGVIFANVWQSYRIAMIAPDSGMVSGWLDLTGLLPASERSRVDVLNGIAYDGHGDRLFVTGKWWPTVFQVEVIR
jgi:glutaminyl-peptide cyclotransferase